MGTRERSPLYPSSSWTDCIEFAKIIDSFKLKAVSYTEVAKKYGINNTTTRSFMSKISSSKQYGLITTSNGNTIQLTDTCKRILFPTDKDTRSIELACFSMPPLYNKLVANFDGKALPSESILGNVLMNEHHIARSVKDAAAHCFIESAEQLGILQGGVLVYSELLQANNNESSTQDAPSDERIIKDVMEQQASAVLPETNRYVGGPYTESDFITTAVPMSSGKVAKIIIPIDADEDNLLLLKDTFESILRRKFKVNDGLPK